MSLRLFILFTLVLSFAVGCQKGSSSSSAKLSKSELDLAMKDLYELTKGATPGDPTTVKLSYEPKTETGREFKRLFAKSAGVEKEMQVVTEATDFENLFSVDRLSTAAGRDKSYAQLTRIEEASEKYYDASGKIAAELFQLIERASGVTPDNGASTIRENRQVAVKSAEMWKAGKDIVEIAKKGNAKKERGTLVFAKDTDIDAYNKAFARYRQLANDANDYLTKVMAERQRRFATGLSQLGKKLN